MAYTRVNWQDNVTPLDELHLNEMDAGIATLDDELTALDAEVGAIDLTTKVDKDSVVAAASRLMASKLAAADANPTFRIFGDGTIAWGPGGATGQDVVLWRPPAGGGLTLNGSFMPKNVFADQAVVANFGTAQQTELGFFGGYGALVFGTAADANIYRFGAKVLQTDSDLSASGALAAYFDSADQTKGVTLGLSGIAFGRDANTASIARQGSKSLMVSDILNAKGNLLAQAGAANQSWIGTVSGKPGIMLGLTQDVSLYRSAAGILRTDGTIDANALTINGVPVGGGAALPADTVVIAATRIVANKLLAGDANNAWRVLGDGRQEWGAGGATALDTNLYRSAAGTLKTDGGLQVVSQVFSKTFIRANAEGLGAAAGNEVVLGLNNNSFAAGPYISFGANNAWDTNLYRSGAANLKTDGTFLAGSGIASNAGTAGQLFLTTSGGNPAVNFGDASLYRSAANILTTPGRIYTGSYVAAFQGTSSETSLGPARVDFAGGDTNLYRNAAGQLRTDGGIIAGSTSAGAGQSVFRVYTGGGSDRLDIMGDGKLQWADGANPADVNLYRSAANQLRTDSAFVAGGDSGAAGVTSLFLNINAVGVKQVSIGAPDSAGAGFRQLRITN